MAIDLTKLKALELPTKEIEVEILGEKQTVKVSAMSDDMSLDIRDIQKSGEIYETKTRCYILVSCAGMKPEDAELLCCNDGAAAAAIISAILDLTDEFDKARDKMREEAKKKHEAKSTESTEK
jgi:hypothetical protein